MFNCDEYGGNYIDQKYVDERDAWVLDCSQKFLKAVKSELCDNKFASDIALSMAFYYYNCSIFDSTAFFDAHELSYGDAVCYLHDVTGKYESEIDEAYFEYTEER